MFWPTEVIGECSKKKFKGEGHEFEDLKARFCFNRCCPQKELLDSVRPTGQILMATYKKWFKEVYPFEDVSKTFR